MSGGKQRRLPDPHATLTPSASSSAHAVNPLSCDLRCRVSDTDTITVQTHAPVSSKDCGCADQEKRTPL